MNAEANVHVPLAMDNCQRKYLLTVASTASATMPDLGVTAAVMLPDVAPDNAEKSPLAVLAAASSMDNVTAPVDENNW